MHLFNDMENCSRNLKQNHAQICVTSCNYNRCDYKVSITNEVIIGSWVKLYRQKDLKLDYFYF